MHGDVNTGILVGTKSGTKSGIYSIQVVKGGRLSVHHCLMEKYVGEDYCVLDGHEIEIEICPRFCGVVGLAG